MATLDPLSFRFQRQGIVLDKRGPEPVAALLPRIVHRLQDPEVAALACKAGLATCGAVCDVLVLRSWLRWYTRLSSVSAGEPLPTSAVSHTQSSADEMPRRVSRSTQPNMVTAAMQRHHSAVLAVLLAFGAGIGFTVWGRRRAARRKQQACKVIDVEAPSSTPGTSGTDAFVNRWESMPRTPFMRARRGIATSNFSEELPSSTLRTSQPCTLEASDSEPEEEDAVGRERKPKPGKAGYVRQKTTEFNNQVPFYRICTESHGPDGTGDTGEGDVVPEGFVRAYAQELQSKAVTRTTSLTGKDGEVLDAVERTKEELLDCCAKVLYNSCNNNDVTEECEESFRVVESMLPEDGFASGLDYPTAPDMAVLNMVTSCQHSGTAKGNAFSQYPKIKALAQRTAAARAAQGLDPVSLV